MIKQREVTKRDSLSIDRQLFEQRTGLRNVKQNLPDQYKHGDEDLLINQKVGRPLPLVLKKKTDVMTQKKKPLELPQRPPGSQLRMSTRPDGRASEHELITLAETLAEREREVQEEIDQKIAAHTYWNLGSVDCTMAPLTPPPEVGVGSTFRTATTEYLPTPPASVSSEQSGDGGQADAARVNGSKPNVEAVAVRYASPSFDGLQRSQPSFRRRHGRGGGRLMIDRRGPKSPFRGNPETTFLDAKSDRYRFDDDDEDDIHIEVVDPFDNESVRFRSRLFPPHNHQAQQAAALRRAQMEAAAAQNARSMNAAGAATAATTSGRPRTGG